MKKMFRDKWIDVEEVKEIETSWHYMYGLYKRGNTYCVQEDDDGKYVNELGKYDSDEAAIKDFEEYMKNLELEVTR